MKAMIFALTPSNKYEYLGWGSHYTFEKSVESCRTGNVFSFRMIRSNSNDLRNYRRYEYMPPDEHIVRFKLISPYASRVPVVYLLIDAEYNEALSTFKSLVEHKIATEDETFYCDSGPEIFNRYCKQQLDENGDEFIEELKKADVSALVYALWVAGKMTY